MEGSNPSDEPVAPLLPRGGGDGPEKRPRTSSSGSSKVQPPPQPQKKRSSSARMDAMRKRSETFDSSNLDSVPSLPRLATTKQPQYRPQAATLAAPTEMVTLPLPSTFHQEPSFVRRLSVSLNTQEPLLSTSLGRKNNTAVVPGGEPGEMYFRGRRLEDDDSDERDGIFARLLGSRRARRRKKKTRRVCAKDGNANVTYKNVSEKRRRYVIDIYTTLVESSWAFTLFLFAMSFYVTWVTYAILYYLICLFHGDFDQEHIAKWMAEHNAPGTPKDELIPYPPCVWEVDGFAASFLFSLETQHTIGYGSRQTTTECVEAMIVMSTQSILGCLIQAFMVGLVFAKLTIPKQRAKTVVFSKNCVISERDKKLCMVFRVGDMREDSFIVGAQLSAKLIRRKVTDEGEMFHDVTPIEISPDSSNEPCIFLIWPITVIHVIDEDSPFYKLSAPELAADKFELHVALEGTIEASGMTFQARTSYLPNEILWGHRFEPMMIYRKDHNKYQINFSAFNSTYEVDTPLCSSKDLDAHYEQREKMAEKSPPYPIRRFHSSVTAPVMPRIIVGDETGSQGSRNNGARRAKNFMDGMEAERRALKAGASDGDDEEDDGIRTGVDAEKGSSSSLSSLTSQPDEEEDSKHSRGGLEMA